MTCRPLGRRCDQRLMKELLDSLRRELKAGAVPLPGYTRLDQGAGVVNVGNSWAALQRMIEGDEDRILLGYRIETFSPAYADEKGSAGYWRYGRALPATTATAAAEHPA